MPVPTSLISTYRVQESGIAMDLKAFPKGYELESIRGLQNQNASYTSSPIP